MLTDTKLDELLEPILKAATREDMRAAMRAAVEGASRKADAIRTLLCASEDCGGPSEIYFVSGGVGSFHCSDCYQKILQLSTHPVTPPLNTGSPEYGQ